jgi:hypothetical protein
MSMLNDRDRHLLNDLENQLEHDDPTWVRQFKDPRPIRSARRDLVLEVAIGLSALLLATALLLRSPATAVLFGILAGVLTHTHYHLPPPNQRTRQQ